MGIDQFFILRCGHGDGEHLIVEDSISISLLGEAIGTIITKNQGKEVIVVSSTVSQARISADIIYKYLQLIGLSVKLYFDTKLEIKAKEKGKISEILKLVQDSSKIIILVTDDGDKNSYYKYSNDSKCPTIRHLLEHLTSKEIGYKIDVKYPNPVGRFFTCRNQAWVINTRLRKISIMGPFANC